jgi:hypothetical protein
MASYLHTKTTTTNEEFPPQNSTLSLILPGDNAYCVLSIVSGTVHHNSFHAYFLPTFSFLMTQIFSRWIIQEIERPCCCQIILLFGKDSR